MEDFSRYGQLCFHHCHGVSQNLFIIHIYIHVIIVVIAARAVCQEVDCIRFLFRAFVARYCASYVSVFYGTYSIRLPSLEFEYSQWARVNNTHGAYLH